MSISLQKFAKGFSFQKGAIFGFGENVNNDTGSVLKISQLEETEIEHMKQSKLPPIQNMGADRSVGFSNYETGIRIKKNFVSASRKIIFNKSNDIIDKKANFVFRKFRS